MHGAGPLMRTLTGRANTWQIALIASALIGLGALLVALGQYRGGIVGIVGVVLLWRIVRGRRARGTRVHQADQGQP